MKQNQSAEGRSPIRVKPLRLPGQSLDEELRRLYEEKFLYYYWLSAAFIILALVEWWRSLADLKPQPVIYTLSAAAVVGFSVHKIRKLRSHVHALELGLEGERSVGQALEELRVSGYRVFHDIVGDGFNMDHVVVAPQGIFLIETKTRTKPDRKDARVTFDGKRVLVDGYESERDPVEQVKRLRRWLAGKLEETTGKKFPIRAVILFPGWWVEFDPRTLDGPMWVMNPKVLPGRIAKSRVQLSQQEMDLAAAHLAALIRLHAG